MTARFGLPEVTKETDDSVRWAAQLAGKPMCIELVALIYDSPLCYERELDWWFLGNTARTHCRLLSLAEARAIIKSANKRYIQIREDYKALLEF